MLLRRASLIGVSLLLALSLTSCGEDKASPATADEVVASKAPEAPSNDEVRAYFEAVWSADATKTKEAIEMAAPGSKAAAYATYLAGNAQADLDAGQTRSGMLEVEDVAGGFKQCETLDNGSDACTEATDIKHVDGKVANFSTGGSPIGDRLVLGNDKSESLGDLGTAKLIAAYRTASGDLFAVFELKSNIDGLGINYDTNYVAPDGRQTQTGRVTSPSELGNGSLANATIVFQGAEFGGKINLNVYTAAGNFAQASASFNIK